MNEKLVSVIIPTYKRSDTLPRAIDSVLRQGYKNVEVIVVDDNNPKTEFRASTEKIMAQYVSNKKIKYIKHDINKNGSAARNTGFRNSNGEFVMFLDDDDEFLENKIREQVRCLEERDYEWGACYTRYIRKKNDRIVMTCAETREGNLLIEELMRNLFVHAGSNLMIRREIFQELCGFDESFQRNQDVEFLVRLLHKYKLAFVDVLGLVVYVHPRVNNQSFEKLTIQYLEKFDCYIKQLNKDAQNKIYRMINLQIFRSKLSEKNIKNILSLFKEKKILFFDATRYIIHLFIRKLTKKSYGFKL